MPYFPPRHPYTAGPWCWHDNSLRPLNPDPQHSAVHTILQREGGSGYLGSKPSDTLRELDATLDVIQRAPALLEALRQLHAVCEALDAATPRNPQTASAYLAYVSAMAAANQALQGMPLPTGHPALQKAHA